MTDENNNTGYGNSGYGNSGHWNSGHWNSGHWNSGYGNSGYGNSCSRSSGIFCTETPALFCFNKPTNKKWEEIDHPSFVDFHLTRWINDSEMTDLEKIQNPTFHAFRGYLRKFSYQEAWANYWRDSGEEEKRKILNLPNFNAEIFKEITGIEVNNNVADCSGATVVIDGKEYILTLKGK